MVKYSSWQQLGRKERVEYKMDKSRAEGMARSPNEFPLKASPWDSMLPGRLYPCYCGKHVKT